MPNNYLSVLNKHIIQVYTQNINYYDWFCDSRKRFPFLNFFFFKYFSNSQ